MCVNAENLMYGEDDFLHLPSPSEKTGDAPQLRPGHYSHHLIPWFECFYPKCTDHKWQKLQYFVNPVRKEGFVYEETHDYDNDEEWRVTVRKPHEWECQGTDPRYARIIEVQPAAPNNCVRGRTSYEDCREIRCNRHLHDKLKEWHINQDRNERLRTRARQETRDRRHWIYDRNELPWQAVGEYGTLGTNVERATWQWNLGTPTDKELGKDQGGSHAPSGSN